MRCIWEWQENQFSRLRLFKRSLICQFNEIDSSVLCQDWTRRKQRFRLSAAFLHPLWFLWANFYLSLVSRSDEFCFWLYRLAADVDNPFLLQFGEKWKLQFTDKRFFIRIHHLWIVSIEMSFKLGKTKRSYDRGNARVPRA